jgi:hypothetical protein
MLNLDSRVQVLGFDEGEIGAAKKGHDKISALEVVEDKYLIVGTFSGFIKVSSSNCQKIKKYCE